MIKNLLKWLGIEIHSHTFSKWIVVKAMSSVGTGCYKIIQERHCACCGFTQIKEQVA
jgi:hypothetical protein